MHASPEDFTLDNSAHSPYLFSPKIFSCHAFFSSLSSPLSPSSLSTPSPLPPLMMNSAPWLPGLYSCASYRSNF